MTEGGGGDGISLLLLAREKLFLATQEWSVLIVLVTLATAMASWKAFSAYRVKLKRADSASVVPESVNYHFTRTCNYSCGFCFHTAKTSFVLPLEQAKKGLSMLAASGMKKVNFSGGEPFIVDRGRYLGKLVRYCKEDLRLESVTVVTNGSRVTESWMEDYAQHLDILAVSCDSFDEEVNKKIGRHAKSKSHLETMREVRNLCRTYGILFKLNTVVNSFNVDEDMSGEVEELEPVRWKVFQCLEIEAENIGEGALRQVKPFLVTDEQFKAFLRRHGRVKPMVPETNEAMRNSYLIVDECMRFLDNTGGEKKPSKSILDVGVRNAMMFSGFDEAMFLKRGGRYNWSKKGQEMSW